MIKIDREKSCAFTGHRYLEDDFDKKLLSEEIFKAIDAGYDTFLVGMAVGFDSECFRLLERIRRVKPIKIIACIPCVNQADKFSEKQRREYFRMLGEADEKIYLSEYYYSGCMQKRNKFMVDNSSLIIAYLRLTGGGTYSTVNYAERQGVKIIRI